MTDYLVWFAETAWLFLPAYFANAAPVLLHGGGAVDRGYNWSDGRRVLGDHKTVIGCISGIFVGAVIALIQGNLIQGFLFSLGAILGDLLFAFIKRRIGYPPGSSWPIGDQVGFIVLAILFGSLIEPRPTIWQDVVMILTTIPVHYVTNLFAWGLRWKDRPW